MKTAGRVLATMIAMVAILLIAVGADKGLNYLERIKYEKECEELLSLIHIFTHIFYSSAMPIHKLPDCTDLANKYTCFPAAYFMSGICPIEMIA